MTGPEMNKNAASGSGPGAPAETASSSAQAVASDSELEARTSFSGDRGPDDIGTYYRNWFARVRGGEIGSLPALLGLIVLVAVFWGLNGSVFVSAHNFGNLMTQAGSVWVLALGIVFVLLLGEIDLAAGVVGGVASAAMAVEIVNHNWVWWIALLFGIVIGVAMGALTGFLVAVVGIPSFVVSLAFFLAWQGVLLGIAGEGGTVPVTQDQLVAIENGQPTALWSWIGVIVVIAVYFAFNIYTWNDRRRRKLLNVPFPVVLIRSAGFGVVLALVAWYLTVNRGFGVYQAGIPWIVPIVGVLFILWTFVLSRTAFGRYVYAIGGNKEAARRAGIRVRWIMICCFMISSGMAAFSGVVEASRLNSVAASSGTGNQLLFAVAAAVIGGTSLFGGRGRPRDAIIGGLVISLIPNGINLVTQSSVWVYIVTGGVLLLAAAIDAVTRRRRASSGR